MKRFEEGCIAFDDSRSVSPNREALERLYSTYNLKKGLTASSVRTLYEFMCSLTGNLLDAAVLGKFVSVKVTGKATRTVVERILHAFEGEGIISNIWKGYAFDKALQGDMPKHDRTKIQPSDKILQFVDPASIGISRAWSSVVRERSVTKPLKHRAEESRFLQDCVVAFQPRCNVPIRKFVRIFTDNEYSGGRIYSNYQLMSKEMRSKIVIDNKPTCEIDYQANQVKMLFKIFEVSFDGDPYDGFGVDRAIAKKALNVLINAKTPGKVLCDSRYTSAFRWSRKKADGFIVKVCDRYPIFGRLIGSGLGLQLQKIEGDIALDIMRNALDESLVALPVHDSFIVCEEHSTWLDQTMQTVWDVVVDREKHHVISIVEGLNID